MTIWYVSDWHFNHNKKFIYEARGFETIYAMNEAIIENHNKYVSQNDIVYVLGDLCLGGGSIENLKQCKKMISSMKGELKIILGNHDTAQRTQMYTECWNAEVVGYATMMNFDKFHFYLSHYPTITSNLDYDKPLNQRTLNLFGHTHAETLFYEKNPMMYNVAVDAHLCKPVSMEEIILDIKTYFMHQTHNEVF